jgi:hypothetical protein
MLGGIRAEDPARRAGGRWTLMPVRWLSTDRYGAPETKTDKPRGWQDLDRSDN